MIHFRKRISILLVCYLSTMSNVHCMDFVGLFSKNNVADLIKQSDRINGGSTANLYVPKKYPNMVIKSFGLGDGDRNEEAIVARQLMKNDIPNSLMKCFGVINSNNIVYERINGETLRNWLLKNDDVKIPFDNFCKDWVLSIFEGMQYFYKNVKIEVEVPVGDGEDEESDDENNQTTNKIQQTKKAKFRCLPGDMSYINIMVRYPDASKKEKYPTPVRVDYDKPDFWGNTDVLMRLADMMATVMKKKVDYTEEQKEKFDKLFTFLSFSGVYNTEKAEKYWFKPSPLLKELHKIID